MQQHGLQLEQYGSGVAVFTRPRTCDCGQPARVQDAGGDWICVRCRMLESRLERERRREEAREDAKFLLESCVMFNRQADKWLRRRGLGAGVYMDDDLGSV